MLTFYQPLLEQIATTPLNACASTLYQAISKGLDSQRYGDLTAWLEALYALPTVDPQTLSVDLNDTIQVIIDPLHEDTHLAIEHSLKALIPWRKGPWQIGKTVIDTEWRSDWKWQRVAPHIGSLNHKQVLDVGCGNGYHCLRMLADGATRVIGIDPSPRFVVQFYMIKHFLGHIACDVLPLTLDDLPDNLGSFDVTFSMGVFYHRRSPIDHLRQLKNTLKAGGQLVLETLVIDGNEGQVLLPSDRYAQMRNVWFLPSVPTLIQWLERCGFKHVRCVDVNQTSIEEQRATPWMQYQSLSDFLDPEDPNKTIEGYPAPTRAIFIADL